MQEGGGVLLSHALVAMIFGLPLVLLAVCILAIAAKYRSDTSYGLFMCHHKHLGSANIFRGQFKS